ncbi:acyl-CoA dehydrogenase family protein [Actinomadura kijaniata]|uniref:acyl-CoA dehydrogenase family protein n=1 Tax=Actinomadura kijaniata TaxID=46161 RepID=UPI00082C2031|nr:acyl-CoA dehydrogenase family protein [Actinomadura kijaniata]
MGLVATEEQQELRETLRRFFADKSPGAEVRRLMEGEAGYEPEVWARMGGQLGLQGLAVPEEYGGAGFGVRELAVVFEEMGRTLVCAPYLATVMGAEALLSSGDEALRREWLPGIASGERIATLAWVEGRSWDLDDVAMEAVRDGDGWVLDGVKTLVLDGHVADVVLVVARAAGGLGLFAVEGGAGGLARAVLPTVDQTRRLARLEFSGVAARRVAGGDVRRALDVGLVGLAAEQLGGAQRALEMTVEYVKVRRQFGRPIGSFQAIKHRCADMFVRVESARSAVLQAASVADEDPAELPVAAALAKAYCSDAYFHVAAETVQMHGGIGFTWEHDAHLYFKRARASQEMFGPPADHRRRLAALLGIGP